MALGKAKCSQDENQERCFKCSRYVLHSAPLLAAKAKDQYRTTVDLAV